MAFIRKKLKSTSIRTFLVYPLVVVVAELLLNGGGLRIQPWFLPLMVWGFVQYRLVGDYRLPLAGGGRGMDTMPERLITTGPYALCRNPMYLGHIIFLAGLTLSLQSVFGGLITVATAVWFYQRVLRDERRLSQAFGEQYLDYTARVKRWIPGLF